MKIPISTLSWVEAYKTEGPRSVASVLFRNGLFNPSVAADVTLELPHVFEPNQKRALMLHKAPSD